VPPQTQDTWTTRLPANAVLYGPRTKGARLGTPAQIASDASWQAVTGQM